MVHYDDKPGHAEELENKPGAVFSEKAAVSDFRAEAIEAENVEHNMTVIEAMKAYPMASFWAFVMSCTIVCFPRQNFKVQQTDSLSDHGILRCLPHG